MRKPRGPSVSTAYSLDNELLSAEDIEALLAGTDGLALLRGRWVEVDRARMSRLLARFQGVEAAAQAQGLDFAQAIKNPASPQTRAVKALQAQARIALTGTPVENRLGDLWSIFDFITPACSATPRPLVVLPSNWRSARTTRMALARTGPAPHPAAAEKRQGRDRRPARQDRAQRLLSAQPQAGCALPAGRRRPGGATRLADGMQRRGMVLAALMRFKQICNHPSQWLGDGAWAEAVSGKFARLRALCETIAAKQEKLLLFTHFSRPRLR